MSDPRVSVIVPVHNTERYLAECLDSILGQTEEDIEVICVDDGSTDSSPKILASYAGRDGRLRVITQECRGAGAARNHGLSAARGTYLSFLDADDFFEPDMLKSAADKLDDTGADIVAFETLLSDEAQTGSRWAGWTFVEQNLPSEDVFSPADLHDHLFNTFGNYTWNKLFRSALIRDNQIEFQEISRTNDLLFTCSALSLAKRITTIRRPFVHYRVSSSTSLQATNDRDPAAFFKAFCALQDFLIGQGLYSPEIERSFLNHALDGVVSNTESLKTSEGFAVIKNVALIEIEPRFGFLSHPSDYYYSPQQLETYRKLLSTSDSDYLIFRGTVLRGERENLLWEVVRKDEEIASLQGRTRDLQREVDELRREVSEARQEIEDIRSSHSFRIGCALTAPVRHVRSFLS